MKSEIFVILTFDEPTNDKINHFFKNLIKDIKVIKHPHITIAHFSNISEKKLIKYSNNFMEKYQNERIVLIPKKIDFLTEKFIACFFEENIQLNKMHKLFNRKFIKLLGFHTLKENWIPHCTVFSGEEYQNKQIYKICENEKINFSLKIKALQLSKINNDNSFTIIYSKKFID